MKSEEKKTFPGQGSPEIADRVASLQRKSNLMEPDLRDPFRML